MLRILLAAGQFLIATSFLLDVPTASAQPLFSEENSAFCQAYDLMKFAQDAEAGKVDHVQLCKEFGGDNCSLSKSLAESICRIEGGDNCTFTKSLGEGICRALKGNNCTFTKSLGEGICRASGGDNCTFTQSFEEGICRALKGDNCSLSKNLGEGICRGLKGTGCAFVDDPTEIFVWQRRLVKYCSN